MPCQWLVQAVHTMGGDEANLALCYHKALDFAAERGLRTIAFSALGTSLNLKCPGERVAWVALSAISG